MTRRSKAHFLGTFLLAVLAQSLTARGAEVGKMRADASTDPDRVRLGMFILGARYGREAVCHWPSHSDLEFVKDYLASVPDRDLRNDFFKAFGTAAASTMGAANRDPSGVAGLCDSKQKATVNEAADRVREEFKS